MDAKHDASDLLVQVRDIYNHQSDYEFNGDTFSAAELFAEQNRISGNLDMLRHAAALCYHDYSRCAVPTLVPPADDHKTLPGRKPPVAVTGSFLITAGVPIQASPTDKYWVFQQWSVNAPLPPGGHAYISSTPDGTGPIIVDNGVWVNGFTGGAGGFATTLNDPMTHQGQAAAVSYKAVDPMDVTQQSRVDGWWYIQLEDSGYTYTASPLFLVIKGP